MKKKIFILFSGLSFFILNSQSLDIHFNPFIASENIEPIWVGSIKQQNDGKILVGGYYGGTFCIARLNSNGTKDSTFVTPIYGGGISDIAIQSDGKILVVGSFWMSGNTGQNICRLNTDGTVDTSFNTGRGTDISIKKVLIQPDGKIIICGGFLNYDNKEHHKIARLNSDGSLDESFNANGFISSESIVNDILLLENGQILAAATIFGGDASNGVVRINTDGTKDYSFKTDILNMNPGMVVNSIALQNDGKILMAGIFRFNSEDFNQPNKYLARLERNGELDSSFLILDRDRVEHETGSFLKKVLVKQDGSIFIAGEISFIDGHSRHYLAKLEDNGKVDLNFETGAGSDDVINTIELQKDSKILVGGEFLTYNNIQRRGIARIFDDKILSVNNSILPKYNVFPNPATDFINVDGETEIKIIRLVNMDGKVIFQKKISSKNYTLNTSDLPTGAYMMQIISNVGVANQKFIKQ